MSNAKNKIIEKAAAIIRSGGTVAFPTETVYGLGADALSPNAAAKIFEIKRRPRFDPLIVHIANAGDLENIASEIPPGARKLCAAFWPGPLTVVLPKNPVIPDIVTAGKPNVAARVPANNVARQIIAAANTPVAAPSANLFGSVSPTTADHVREQLGGLVEMIVDGGACAVGVESTIVSFVGKTPQLLRPGGTTLEAITDVIGVVEIPKYGEMLHESPGRGESHYATSAPLVLIESIDDVGAMKSDNVGLLMFAPVNWRSLPPQVARAECLSKSGELREAACNLFAALRRLDAANVDIIAALPVPNTGLGFAINDRLFRASRKRQ